MFYKITPLPIDLLYSTAIKAAIRGAYTIFTDPVPLGNHELNPDTVLSKDNLPFNIIEIKYKFFLKKPNRYHIEQLSAYAFRYNTKCVDFLYPAAEKQGTTLTSLGAVNGVKYYKMTLDLSADDLRESENELRDLVYGEFANSGNGQ